MTINRKYKYDSVGIAFLAVLIGLCSLGCTKAPPPPRAIPTFTAGDSTSVNVVYVNIINTHGANQDGININHDSSADILFESIDEHVSAAAYNVYNYVKTGSGASICLTALNQGDNIDNSLNWQTGILLMIKDQHSGYPPPNNYDVYTGPWANVKTGYLAFKIIKGPNTFVGWIKLESNIATSFAFIKS